MSHLKKITKIVVNVFTCLLLFLLILVIYGKLVMTFGENKYPNYFGYTFFEVASGSMEPALHINDVVLVKITNKDLKANDIIAFQSDKAIITHRILFIDGDIITVKGDSNNVVDKPITFNQVIGKIVKVFPELDVWKKVLTDPKILFAIFVTLLLFDFALSYGDKDNKKIEKMLDLDEGKSIAELVSNEPSNKVVKEEKKKVIESVISGNKDILTFKVIDTGIGIKKADNAKLFEKFERLDQEQTDIQGTKLGLVITKKLLDLMDGKISFESEYQKGTTFTINLEQEILDKSEVDFETYQAKKLSVDEYFDGSKYRVLLVDDNLLNLKVAEKLLKKYNLNVTSVNSGLDCLNITKIINLI